VFQVNKFIHSDSDKLKNFIGKNFNLFLSLNIQIGNMMDLMGFR